MPRSRTPGGAYECSPMEGMRTVPYGEPLAWTRTGPLVSVHLPCGGDWRDALHVAPPVLLDVDDLKSRSDVVVARLAGSEEEHEITHYDPPGLRFLQSSDDDPVQWWRCHG